MQPAPARLVLVALALASCRAFPVGLYVPGEVLDTLERSRFEEQLDEHALEAELVRLAGGPVPAVRGDEDEYWRLDGSSARGPFAATECGREPAAAGLAPGDLVLVKHPRAQSLATTLTFEPFTFYDHLGVLVERGGELCVCDSWPSFHPLGKAPDFAGRFRGGVRITPFGRFLAHYEALLVVRLPDPERNARLAAAALAALEERIEYDPYHDPADPRLSCSEFVCALLARAGYAGPDAPRALAPDAELRAVLAALGFPTGGFFAPDQFAALPGAREVACFGRWPARAALRGLEAAFALLHERFLAGELRLADVLAIDRFRFLRYRPNAALFLRRAEGLAALERFAEPSELRAGLAALFDLCFWPLPPGHARLQPGILPLLLSSSPPLRLSSASALRALRATFPE